MQARDVMVKDVITVSADASLREAAELLIEHKISGIPVVDDSGKVCGMISESDILDPVKRRSALPRSALFGLTPLSEKALMAAYDQGMSLKVRDLMTESVTCAAEDTPLRQLAGTMVSEKINRIPVVRDGKLVGMVARDDILKALIEPEAGKL